MIRDYLVPALKDRFPERAFVFGEPPAPEATIVFPYPEIGPVEICDDGDEVTVFIGRVTHGHFGCYEESLSEDEKQKKIVADVTEFLAALFEDRVVLLRIFRGWSGGWRLLKPHEHPKRSWFWEQFLWSRPLRN
jgi:hypothetical protein